MEARHKVKRRYKGQKEPTRKTDRRELSALHRAMAVASHQVGKQSCQQISDSFKDANIEISRSGVQKLIQRTLQRVKDTETTIYNPDVYNLEPGQGRREILTNDQKDQLFQAATNSKACRMLTTYQLREILPPEFSGCSTSTLECGLYERGLGRVKGFWKPVITPEKMRARYDFAQKHNPDPPVSSIGMTWCSWMKLQQRLVTSEACNVYGQQQNRSMTIILN